MVFDEMRAVESSYTFLIQDENLPQDDTGGNLLSQIDDNRLSRLYAHLALYASPLCDLLRDCKKPSLVRSQPWTIVVKAIEKEIWSPGPPTTKAAHDLFYSV